MFVVINYIFEIPIIEPPILDTKNQMKNLNLFILSILAGTLNAQIALNNQGALTFQINNALQVHSDGDVSNLTGATMVLGSTGEPNLEFDGHFTNSATATLTTGTGLLELTGSSSQNLDFGGDDLYNLEIVNAAGGVFTSAATVNNEVQFNSGDFTTTDANLLTFETSATAAGATDASHVNGPVSKNFPSDSPFTFPVGHGSSYNSLAFTPDGAGATTMKAKFNFAQPSDRSSKGAGVCKVSNVEYWDFTRTSGSEDGTVTLEWDTESDVTVLGDLLVAYWDGSAWQDGGGTASGAAGSGTIPSGSSISSFSSFTIGTDPCSNTLPVELIKFTAVPMNNEVVNVDWTTASELNNDYFVVERSKDAVNYIVLDSLTSYGNGNSSNLQNYNLIDKQPYSGVSYYRLRQVDFDKAYSYSNIEIVNFEGLEIISLFPNPSDGEVNITVKSSFEGTLQLTIYDALGKLIKSEELNIMEGNTQINSMIIGATGKYFVSVVTSDGKHYDYDVLLKK